METIAASPRHRSVAGGAGYRVCVRAVLPGTGSGAGAGIWPAHWMMPAAVADVPPPKQMCDPDGGEARRGGRRLALLL